MLRSLVSEINVALSNNDSNIDQIEEEIAKGIYEYYKDSLFFTPPIKNIISILKRSEVNKVDIISK